MPRTLLMIAAVTLSLAPAWARGDQAEERSGGARAGRAGSYDIPDVDPQDPSERFAILLPGGPLIVEATMTIDGEPFRMKRDAFITDFLKAADGDHDGVVTWQEMLIAPPCAGTIIDRQYTRFVRMLDWDRDGTVSRREARGLMAALFDGPAFLVSGLADDSENGAVATSSDLFGLLDLDDDDVLSQGEIARAGETLIARDADGNELLDPREIESRDAKLQNRRQVWRAPERFDELDINKDRLLTEQEFSDLNNREPDLRVTVDFSGDAAESSLTVNYVYGGSVSPDDRTTLVEWHGARLRLIARSFPDLPTRYEAAVEQVFVQWDGNGNGYLEKDELLAGRSEEFSRWDRDLDGKVFLQEFRQEFVDYELQALAPKLTQIMVEVGPVRDPVRAALDLNGDSRLSLREMKTASAQLASLDADRDGDVARREIPDSHAVNFRIGGRSLEIDQVPFNTPGEQPAWFVRMDRNGDGDVTLREFLGDREAFEGIDTNGDGFIEPVEAKSAAAPAGARPD